MTGGAMMRSASPAVVETTEQGQHPSEELVRTAPSAKPPFDKSAAASLLALSVAACGGSSGSTSGSGGSDTLAVKKPQSDGEAARFLMRASFAVGTGAIEALKDEGYERWLDTQMRAANDTSARQYFAAHGFDKVDAEKHYNSPRTGDWMIWSQLLVGGNSVRKRIALALSEFFVVSLSSVEMTWRSPAIGEYWDILNRHAFGSFRDLIGDITINSAMGVFLNTRGNRKADPRTGRVPDENYGREIMQLFSIGLYELNQDGSRKLANGAPIETYGNDDVTGIAKVFTGFDFDYQGIGYTTEVGGTRQIPDAEYARRAMTADPSRWQRPRSDGFHADEEKKFLGLTIPAGTGPQDSLRMALDHLVSHPNVAPFFASQMIQRLVTSNPSPAYVERVADVFADNGKGVRGDLAAVFKAILLDEEALDPANATNANFGRLREPMLRFIQLARTFGARSNSREWRIGDLSDAGRLLGQSPLRSPSVFNFFRPGYFPTNTQLAQQGLLAPEFQLVNETSVAAYVNFLERVVEGERYPIEDITLDYSAEAQIAHDTAALVDRLDLLLTGNQLSQETRATIAEAVDSVTIAAASEGDDRLRRVRIAVLLVFASSDYLIQK